MNTDRTVLYDNRQHMLRVLYVLAAARFAVVTVTSWPMGVTAGPTSEASGFHVPPSPAILSDDSAEMSTDDDDGRPISHLLAIVTPVTSWVTQPFTTGDGGEPSDLSTDRPSIFRLAPKLGPPRG